MPTPQSGILPEGNSTACFITATITAKESKLAQVRQACAMIPVLTQEVGRMDPSSQLTSVVAIGADAWDRLYPQARPIALRPFQAHSEGNRHAPATKADLLFHLRSEARGLHFLLVDKILAAFGENITLQEQVDGFRYLDSRDLTGFVDGTENPAGEERAAVALTQHETTALLNAGSYVSSQRYIHDLAQWKKLATADQEAVIGRTKADDKELAEDIKPPTAHISRVVIEENGEELAVLRHSMPYGNSHEAGLFFIAYGATPDPFEKMLKQMIHADAKAHYDHLLNYTRAVSGSAFFAPCLEFLSQWQVASS